MTIQIDGKDLQFTANAGTWWKYRKTFKKDLLTECTALAKRLQKSLQEDGEEAKEAAEMEILNNFDIIQQAAYIMNAQAEKRETSYEDYLEWLYDFSPLAFLNIDAAGAIIGLLFDDLGTLQKKTATPQPMKKKTQKKTAGT